MAKTWGRRRQPRLDERSRFLGIAGWAVLLNEIRPAGMKSAPARNISSDAAMSAFESIIPTTGVDHAARLDVGQIDRCGMRSVVGMVCKRVAAPVLVHQRRESVVTAQRSVC